MTSTRFGATPDASPSPPTKPAPELVSRGLTDALLILGLAPAPDRRARVELVAAAMLRLRKAAERETLA